MRKCVIAMISISMCSLVALSGCGEKKMTSQQWSAYYTKHQSEVAGDAKKCSSGELKDPNRCNVVISRNFFQN